MPKSNLKAVMMNPLELPQCEAPREVVYACDEPGKQYTCVRRARVIINNHSFCVPHAKDVALALLLRAGANP